MRGLSMVFAAALLATAFATPAAAAGFPGGGPAGPGGAGPILPPGGEGPSGPSGPRGPGGPGGVAPGGHGGPNSGFGPPRHGAPPPPGGPGFAPGHGPHGGWRHRPRHYWFGNGPVFAPEPSGDYVYGGDDYDDGSDPSGCWIYRKAYDRANHFLGWVHIDLCEGQ